MTIMMMANQADPLDSSCTNTKYISWVWRNGLEGMEWTQWLYCTEEKGNNTILMVFISNGKDQQVGLSKNYIMTK